jgi:hypothetical protein
LWRTNFIPTTSERKSSLFAAAGLAISKEAHSYVRSFLSKCISITVHLDPMIHVILLSVLMNANLEDGGGFSFDKQTIFAFGMLGALIVEELV